VCNLIRSYFSSSYYITRGAFSLDMMLPIKSVYRNLAPHNACRHASRRRIPCSGLSPNKTPGQGRKDMTNMTCIQFLASAMPLCQMYESQEYLG
jgi:hypothetical protein